MAKATTIDEYVRNLESPQREIVQEVVDLVGRAAPDASSSIKWAQPVFESDGPFAYAKAYKNHVNFGFWRGAELDDPEGRLEGSGKKMRHVKLTSTDEIDEPAFTAFIEQAVALNAEKGSPA